MNRKNQTSLVAFRSGFRPIVCTDTFSGTLTNDHGILYFWREANDRDGAHKLGELLSGFKNMTPENAFRAAYKAQARGRLSSILVEEMFIFNKREVLDHHSITSRGLDKLIHRNINSFFDSGALPFHVSIGKYRADNVNQEAVLGVNARNKKVFVDFVTRHVDPNELYLDDYRVGVKLRPYQEKIRVKVLDNFDDHKKCLLHGFTGFGKSTVALYLMIEQLVRRGKVCSTRGNNILLTTPAVSTMRSFEEQGLTKAFFNQRVNVVNGELIRKWTEAGIDVAKKLASRKGEINLITLSVQDIRYKTDDDLDREIRELYDFLLHISVDAWIVDERHTNYDGKVTSEVLSHIKPKYTFDLTATPYNLLERGYDQNLIVSCSLMYALKEKRAGNKDFAKLPWLNIYSVTQDALNNANEKIYRLFSSEENWDPRKLNARNANGSLRHVEAFIDLLDLMIGKQATMGKNNLSVVNKVDCKDAMMIIMPEGNNGHNAEKCCEDWARVCNRSALGLKRHFVSSYEIDRQRGDEEVSSFVDALYNEHGKSVVIFTHRKFTVGTDIPQLGALLIFDKMNSISEFEQAAGRVMRSYEGKENAAVFVVCPGMELGVHLCEMAKEEKKANNDVSEKEMYDSIPFSLIGGSIELLPFESAHDEWESEQGRRIGAGVFSKHMLENIDGVTDALVGLSFRDFGKTSLEKMSMTEANGAKVSKPKPKTKKEKEAAKKEKSQLASIRTMLCESISIGFQNECEDIREVYKTELAELWFNKDSCSNMLKFLANENVYRILNPRFIEQRNVLGTILTNRRFAAFYRGFSMNHEYKQKAGLVYTPYELCLEIVSRREIRRAVASANRKGKKARILVLNALDGAFIDALEEVYGENISIDVAEHFGYYVEWLRSFGYNVIELNGEVEELNNVKKKFDVIVGNPPFQKEQVHEGKRGGGDLLWNKFVEKSYELLNDGGYLSLIHPSGWRKPKSDRAKFNNVQDLLFNKMTLKWLRLIGSQEGQKLFGVGSRFDLYVAEKKPYENEAVEVVNEKNESESVSLKGIAFIPNFDVKKIIETFEALKDEKVCDVMFSRNNYGSDKEYVSDKETKKFCYPLVHSTPKAGVRWKFSSRNDRGFFGEGPKVIFGDSGAHEPVIDLNGEYGMTQHAMAIRVDNKKDAEKLVKFLKSDEFASLREACSWSNYQIDWRLFTTFKHGFWR